jgi:hypothetical protein
MKNVSHNTAESSVLFNIYNLHTHLKQQISHQIQESIHPDIPLQERIPPRGFSCIFLYSGKEPLESIHA